MAFGRGDISEYMQPTDGGADACSVFPCSIYLLLEKSVINHGEKNSPSRQRRGTAARSCKSGRAELYPAGRCPLERGNNYFRWIIVGRGKRPPSQRPPFLLLPSCATFFACLAASSRTLARSSGESRAFYRPRSSPAGAAAWRSEEVAPLILEIHGGAVLDGGVVELLDVRPLPAAAPGDTFDERLRLLERPRVVVFAPPAVGARRVRALAISRPSARSSPAAHRSDPPSRCDGHPSSSSPPQTRPSSPPPPSALSESPRPRFTLGPRRPSDFRFFRAQTPLERRARPPSRRRARGRRRRAAHPSSSPNRPR